MSRTLLAFVAVAAAAVAAARSAQAADDDVALAKALAQRGYVDVAVRVLRRASENGARSSSQRAASRLALAQVRRLDAVRASRVRGAGRVPTAELQRLFADAESAYRALLADATQARTARFELARLLVTHAQTAATRDPAGPLLDEALRLALAARDAATADRSAAAEGSPERSRADDEIASVRLLAIEALHARGVAPPPSDVGAAALAQALEEIEKFAWDYAGTLRCAWAFRWRGLVLAAMGRPKEACESLRDAAGAVSERDGVRGAQDMALSAYADLARTAADARTDDADEVVGAALLVIERLSTEWPRHLDTAAGRRARLAAARLHARAGDKSRAVSDARAVLAAAGDQDEDSADDACALLADWTNPRSASGLDVEMLARVARAAARSGDLRRTVDACRAVISACRTTETRDRFAWDAWAAMGRAYGAAELWFEAFVAFDCVERAWRRDPTDARLAEIADTTAFYRADALARLAAQTKDDDDREAARGAMEEFARDHPGSEFASGARGEHAFRALAEASTLRRSGDRAAADARCREALASLTAIDADNPMFERAQALVAEARRQLGDVQEAARLAEAWLDAKRGDPVGPQARRAREQARAQALVTLLTAKADLAAGVADRAQRAAAFGAVLDALARREAEFVALVPRGADRVQAWRAEALLETGDVDAAVPLVVEQTKKPSPTTGARYLAGAAATACLDRAARLRTAGDAVKARESSLTAARFLEFVLSTAESPDAAVARDAAAAFAAGGDLVRAVDLYSLASGLFRGAAAKTTDAAESAKLLDFARSASLDSARSLVALRRFAEARSEAAALLGKDDDAGAATLAKLSAGETIRGADVEWLVRRAAKDRAAVDLLAAAYAGEASRETLTAAAQVVAALRYGLVRGAPPTAESIDLALRHADALARQTLAGAGADAALAAGSVLDETFGSAEALAQAEALVPGSKRRVEELRKLVAEAESKR